MKKQYRALIIIVLSLLSYNVVFAQQEMSTQALSFSDLTLNVETTKDEFAQLEPIPITIRLINQTSHPAMGHSALDFSNNFIKVFFSRGEGQMREVENLSPVRANTAAPSVRIEPGGRFESTQVLSFNLDKNFLQPGVYQIQLTLSDSKWNEEIKSNLITIRVVRPEGINLQAFEYIKHVGAASYFFSGIGFPSQEQQRNVLEDFTYRFGESIYGPYAEFSLGELYFYEKDYKKAAQRLGKVAKRPEFALADKAEKYLNKIREESQR
jgi:hypothetical protein